MPEHMLYGIISFLGLAVIMLGGLWVKAHDSHRQWATEKIAEHERLISVIQANHADLKADTGEIKDTLKEHLLKEEHFQFAMVQRFGLKVMGDEGKT